MPGGDNWDLWCRGMAALWLVVFNIILALLGLGIAMTSFHLRSNSKFFDTNFLNIMASAEVDGIILKSVVELVVMVMIVVGFLIALTGLMGCLGGCCRVKSLLVSYFFIMLGLLIIEIVAIVIFLERRNDIEKGTKNLLQASLDKYKGFDSTEKVTVGWNYVFINFDCCGVDSYRDLDTASDWAKSVTIFGRSLSLTSPVFCCKLDGSFPDITLPSNLDCATAPNSTTSNYMAGCYQSFENYIMGYSRTFIACLVLLLICLCMNVLTVCVVYQDKKNRVLVITPAMAANNENRGLDAREEIPQAIATNNENRGLDAREEITPAIATNNEVSP